MQLNLTFAGRKDKNMEVKKIGETMTRNLLEEVRRQKDMKGIGKRIKKELFPVLSGSVVMMEMLCTRVMAADTSSVTKPLDNLKTLVIAIIGAIGVIILAKNVMEFAQAYQQQDSSTMNSALKGIVAGVMMAGISSVLGILGF